MSAERGADAVSAEETIRPRIHESMTFAEICEQWDALVAERDAARAERDAARDQARLMAENWHAVEENLDQSEKVEDVLRVEVERLREALRRLAEIAADQGPDYSPEHNVLASIFADAAAAALAVQKEPAPRCSGYCVGTTKAETLVEDLACPVHGIEAQEAAKAKYPDRQAWLDALAAVQKEAAE